MKTVSAPMANPLSAFIACVGGRIMEIRVTDSGRKLLGIMIPPSSIEGRNTSCDHSTVVRVVAEITPISTASPVQAMVAARNTRT